MDSKLPAQLLNCIKTGKIVIKEDGKKSVEVKINDKKIDVDLMDVTFNVPQKMGILTKISEARDFAKNLKEQNLTLCILNQTKPVLKLGKDAKPKLSRMVTQSKSVEITDLRELRKLDKRLRIK